MTEIINILTENNIKFESPDDYDIVIKTGKFAFGDHGSEIELVLDNTGSFFELYIAEYDFEHCSMHLGTIDADFRISTTLDEPSQLIGKIEYLCKIIQETVKFVRSLENI